MGARGPKATEPSIRLWNRVVKTDTCWLWTGYTNKKGYGEIGLLGGDWIYTHRLSWQIHHGVIQNGIRVLHSCDNTSCVRPDHLFLGTEADNSKDMVNKERSLRGRKASLQGSQRPQAKLTEQEVKDIRSAWNSGLADTSILAKTYSISMSTIQRITKNKLWRHITP